MVIIVNEPLDMEKLSLLISKYVTAKPDIIKAHFSFLLTAQKFLGKFEGYLSKFKITNSQLSIMLLLLSNEKVPETATSISKKLGLSNATISNVLSTLEKKKFIKKDKLKKDRRVCNIYLTKNGIKFLIEFIPLYYSKYAQFFSDLRSKELNEISLLSFKLSENLDLF